MIMTPSSFSFEQLSSMKFKELQKLSAQFRVNKRWAKKQELIANLLDLKEKFKAQNDDTEEENEWRDGSVVFGDLKQNNESGNDRRLTFKVTTESNSEYVDRHMTFTMPQNGKNLLGETINSRETYDVLNKETDFGVEPFVEVRATFEIPPKKELLDEIDPRATFDVPENGNDLMKEANADINSDVKNIHSLTNNPKVNVKGAEIIVKNDLRRVKLNINKQDEEQERDKEAKLQVKMLTIPYARVTRRNRKEPSRGDSSPIKMSKKSINIKKTTRLPVSKTNLLKSPALSSAKKSVPQKTIIQSLVEAQSGKITQSKVPVRLQFNEERKKAGREGQIRKLEENNKENNKKVLFKRVSNIVEETIKKNSNSIKENFRMRPHSAVRTPLTTDLSGRLNATVTPGYKLAVKPNTAKKMPDFSKIHKRRFEQMDSLPEYLRKKEERVRKLFGVPQPGQQLQSLNKSTPVFRFQSVAVEKEIKGSPVRSSMASNRNKADPKTPQKEAFKNKLPPSKLRTEIKEENRNRIHGVRTNKRFELQMKLRNM